MKFLLLLIPFAILTACTGSSPAQPAGSAEITGTPAKGDTVQEMSANIMVVYQDSKGRYWFGSWKDGVYQYDGKTIRHFTTRDGLPANRVEEIQEDKQGNLYINTSEGLCQFDGSHFRTLTATGGDENDWALDADAIWFKCLSQPRSVYRLRGNTLHRLRLPACPLGEAYVARHPTHPDPYSIYCLYTDSRGNLWFGTSTLGVCRYDGTSFSWISEPDLNEIHNGPANGVRGITEDRNGDFWFNTAYRYRIYAGQSTPDTKGIPSKWYERLKNIGSLDGKADGDLNEYLSIVQDNDNALWMALYLHGVWKYDDGKIQHYPIQVNNQIITVYCLYKDRQGGIWLGTHDNGVFRFDGSGFSPFKV